MTRGCFIGSYEEFVKAVDKRHGIDSPTGTQYALLCEFARLRLGADENGYAPKGGWK